ncbi:DUF6194 family protein [Roseobacter sp. HKCCA0434]|uniref:DUF6194 family protein n=1 Tax=Roseobacter sp. HKCCA0434 TaxID=3079297 RepID=UPI002905F1AD|nr:DUF6194 family protein [Roseobacter sp. HKCCA0434]
MTPALLIEAIRRRHSDLVATDSWGETGLFLNPGGGLKRGVYVATVKTKDGANDRASALDRPGIFRLNIGVPPAVCEALFGRRPTRPSRRGIVNTRHDFAATDTLTPHPVYGWMGWVAILNPSERRWPHLAELIDAAHAKGAAAASKRLAKEQP